MKISVFAVGRKMPVWVEQASADYMKRLPGRWSFNVREFPQAQGGGRPEQSMLQEAQRLLSAIPETAHVVALDNRGDSWSTEQVAAQLQYWQENIRTVVFMIGGADGLHEQCRQRADQLWCLSPLTFPHPIVRVILTEQLYRAYSLLQNHPYHRA